MLELLFFSGGIGFLFLIVLQLAAAFYTSKVVEEKGYKNKDSWFLGGLIFGLIALLAAVGLPDRKTHLILRGMLEK